MQTINKITVLDRCISGDMDNYKTLLNPMCDQFNVFYDMLKSIFVDDALKSSVDEIVFNKDDNTAIFSVECHCISDINLNSIRNKNVSIIQDGNVVHFNVQPNK